jgi:hypothetical protein
MEYYWGIIVSPDLLTFAIFCLFQSPKLTIRDTNGHGYGTEHRQHIKNFRLKYVFLAGKIIRTARSVVRKLSKGRPYQEIYEKSLT